MSTGTMKRRHVEKNNVLLVNITRLGDMLQATPTIAGMKMENPDCKITVLVEKQFAGICDYLPNIDETFALDLGMTVRSLSREQDGIVDAFEYLSEFVDELRSKDFDYCLNMSSSAYTAMLLRLLGVERSGGWNSDEEGHRRIESDWARLFATSVFHQNRQYNSLNLVDVFRCSADVEQHPEQLVAKVPPAARAEVEQMIAAKGFRNEGPLIAIQAGASQGKRQWLPSNFIRLIGELTGKLGARVVMTGTAKELPIIEEIYASVDQSNVLNLAGETNISQLCALLERTELLVTGDTGPMHISVALGTPVISMFLASAFGYETGPYSAGNIVLQPVIGCGPCNPNKPCARPDCHDTISPELVAFLVEQRLKGADFDVPENLAPSQNLIVYRTEFDEFGFYNQVAMNSNRFDPFVPYREAYRRVWLEELGGFSTKDGTKRGAGGSALQLAGPEISIDGIETLVRTAEGGKQLIAQLRRVILDKSAPPEQLTTISGELSKLDREIEEIGYYFGYLGPLSRMFIFAKENLEGTDALNLASQMERIYEDLGVRARKFNAFLELQ